MKRIILLFCIFCQWMYVYSINAIDTNLGQCTSNGRGIMLSTHDGGLLCGNGTSRYRESALFTFR